MAIDAECAAAGLPTGGKTRPVDFQRPVHCMLGMPIDTLSKQQALERIRTAVALRQPCWLSTPNVQYLVTLQKDPAFRDALIEGDMSVADGVPLIWLARLLGVPLKERVAGSDLFEALSRGEGGALKVYFFGGPEGVAELACKRLNALAGPMTCVGFASPGFGTIEQMSAPETIEHINQSGADFVVVALGASKGQAWIERNHRALHAPVISHLGAVINFMAGTVVRAPAWMQHAGLEWLWRIKEEPTLWRRYWGDARLLATLIGTRVLPAVLYRSAARLGGTPAPAAAGVVFNSAEGKTDGPCPVATLVLSGAWSDSDMPLLRRTLERLCREAAHIMVDVSALGRVNGAFIALLMLLHAQQRKAGRRLSLLSPTKELRRHLKLHCADFLLAPLEA